MDTNDRGNSLGLNQVKNVSPACLQTRVHLSVYMGAVEGHLLDLGSSFIYHGSCVDCVFDNMSCELETRTSNWSVGI